MLRRKGFTLLELIIVIIVIGILASIALPRFMKVTEKARTSEAKSALDVLRSAQIRYYAQHGKFTNSVPELDTDVNQTGTYFNLNALVPATPADPVATAARNTVDQTAGSYTIGITVDGNLSITPGSESLL